MRHSRRYSRPVPAISHGRGCPESPVAYFVPQTMGLSLCWASPHAPGCRWRQELFCPGFLQRYCWTHTPWHLRACLGPMSSNEAWHLPTPGLHTPHTCRQVGAATCLLTAVTTPLEALAGKEMVKASIVGSSPLGLRACLLHGMACTGREYTNPQGPSHQCTHTHRCIGMQTAAPCLLRHRVPPRPAQPLPP